MWMRILFISLISSKGERKDGRAHFFWFALDLVMPDIEFK
jgi:hypothetical protein